MNFSTVNVDMDECLFCFDFYFCHFDYPFCFTKFPSYDIVITANESGLREKYE